MLELLQQITTFFTPKFLFAQAYGEGAYGSQNYNNGNSLFGLPLPGTGAELLFIIFAAMVAGGIGILIWRIRSKRSITKTRNSDPQAAPVASSTQLK